MLKSSGGERNPIGRRTQSDRTANGIRSGSGRNPIGRRTESDRTADGIRSDSERKRWICAVVASGGALVSSAPTKQEVHQPSRKCTNQANKSHATRLVHFLLWQAAKPSGDKCTPFKCTNQAISAPTKQMIAMLLGWCTSCSGKRQSRAETSAPPFISPLHAAGRSALRVRSLPRRAAAAWLHPSPCGLLP